MSDKIQKNPRVIITQLLYSRHLNKDINLNFPNHQYKSFIKKVVNGTIERNEIITDLLKKDFNEIINFKKIELIILIIIKASIYELLYRPDTSEKIIINEYLNVAVLFSNDSNKKFLNAVLDKIAKKIRLNE
jgi:Transcription termination factor